jgi:hypothetical protein
MFGLWRQRVGDGPCFVRCRCQSREKSTIEKKLVTRAFMIHLFIRICNGQ